MLTLIELLRQVEIQIHTLREKLEEIGNVLRAPQEIREPAHSLSEREQMIVSLLGEGKKSKEIGEILNISKRTVDTHKQNIKQKLHLSSMRELRSWVRSKKS